MRWDSTRRTRAPTWPRPAWELIGPTSIGGRVLDVVVDHALDRTMFAATASGGVWRSDDAGRTFAPAWPTELDQAIGGTGVYRSDGRGETWELVGLEESSRIGRIVVIDGEGDAPDTVFVAASGDLFRDRGQRGPYRSADGGDTWERVPPGSDRPPGRGRQQRRRRLVVRAHLRRPAGRGPRLPGRAVPGRDDRRGPELEHRAERARRPARDGVGPRG